MRQLLLEAHMVRHRRKISPFIATDNSLEEQIETHGRLYALRILAKSRPEMIARFHDVESDSIAAVLQESECPSLTDLLQKVEAHLKKYEKREIVMLQPLHRNLDLLSQAVPLSSTEKELISLYVIGTHYQPLHDILEALGELADYELIRLLSIALHADRETIRKSVGGKGALRSSGLLTVRCDIESFWPKMGMLEKLTNALLSDHENLDAMLSIFTKKSAPGVYQPQDFDLFQEHMRIVMLYLQNSRKACARGCNILLYGPSGVGKTEAVRTIARELSFGLFEVENEDEQGEPLDGQSRVQNYRFVQALLSAKNDAIILFDEVEDVFPRKANFAQLFEDGPGS
jgi:hypothetical protein